MRLVRSGLLLAFACQGIYWLGVVLERQQEPLALLGMIIIRGYGGFFLAMTAVGLAVAVLGFLSALWGRRRAG